MTDKLRFELEDSKGPTRWPGTFYELERQHFVPKSSPVPEDDTDEEGWYEYEYGSEYRDGWYWILTGVTSCTCGGQDPHEHRREIGSFEDSDQARREGARCREQADNFLRLARVKEMAAERIDEETIRGMDP